MKKPPKCQHRKMPTLAYMAWHEDAAIRHKRGEKQKFCLDCGKYVWESFWKRKAK